MREVDRDTRASEINTLTGASFQGQSRRMLRLIKADLASTEKPHLRNGTPSCFPNLRELNALLWEGSHFGFQIVAHEVEFVGTNLIGRVDCGFSRRQGEDRPAMTRIHGFETEDVAKKCAVRLGVLTVDAYVSTRNHSLSEECPRIPMRPHVPWNLENPIEIKLEHHPRHYGEILNLQSFRGLVLALAARLAQGL